MIRLLIKKTFLDMWDHLLGIAVLNIVGTLLLAGIFYGLQPFTVHPALLFLGVALGMGLFSIYLAVVSRSMKQLADYGSLDLRNAARSLKEEWRSGVAFGGVMYLQLLILVIVMPWYFQRETLWGVGIGAFLFWASVMWLAASQYYFPARHRLTVTLLRVPQKCVLLLLDNTAFTILLALGTVVLSLISVFTVFMFPGVATVMLWHQVALKFRLYKYDYLESHPNARRNQIPWKALLAEDDERVGTRTLRRLIFPWKS